MIGDGDHSEAWRRALDQYFSIVRVFDPLHADADKRLALLASFGELHAPWRDAIDKAVAALQTDYRHRRQRAARAIGTLIIAALSMSETDRIEESTDRQALIDELEKKLKTRLRAQEKTMRGELESIYRHTQLEWQSLGETPISSDLFSRESERLFGLSRGQLVASGAVSGAIAGTSIDVILGGSSLFVFGGISAIVGWRLCAVWQREITQAENTRPFAGFTRSPGWTVSRS